jgi:hypothetical protein
MVMATINDKEMIDDIVANNGYFQDDPRIMRIIEYTNMAGNTAYGIEYEQDIGKYTPSQWVINPKVYWRAK